jgi:hypothetical protein
MISPLPGAWPERPGSATLPFFGVVPVIVDDKARAGFLGLRRPHRPAVQSVCMHVPAVTARCVLCLRACVFKLPCSAHEGQPSCYDAGRFCALKQL